MLKDLKLGLKIGGGFGIILVLTVAVGFFAWTGLNKLNVRVDNNNRLKDIVINLETGRRAEKNFIIRGELSYYEQNKAEIKKLADEAEFLKKRFKDAVNIKQMEEVLSAVDAYSKAMSSYVETVNKFNQLRLDIEKPAGEIAGDVDHMRELLARQLSDLRAAGARTQLDLADDSSQLIQWFLFARLNGKEYQMSSDPKALETVRARLDDIEKLIKDMRRRFQLAENRELADDILAAVNVYRNIYVEMEKVQTEKLKLDEQLVAAGRIVEKAADDASHDQENKMKAEQASTITGILAVTAIAIAFGIVLAIIITAAITGAMRKGVEFATEISRGNLNAELDVNQKDEIGQLAEAMKEMLEALRYKAEIIEKYAEGDFTTDAELASDVDGLGKSLNKMQQSLNDLLSQVNVAVEQVSAGAEQVSNASQNLSQGATEQASSLEEISSSINEINGQSRQNAENSSQANGIAKKATDDAGAGNLQMKDLVKAMEEINTSSEEIKKIIKVIDDIAFQVNLLALNANVEAARAGKYGKGFAVVAEEVRNLAVRSAEAVKETTAMVEESIKSISKGNNLVDNTAKQLESIVGGSTKVADFLSEITIASNEQAQGIDQISEALNQIDQVTQSNTASAEESASAAEELSAQAQQLKGIVGRFKLKKRLMIESRMEGDRHSASVEHLNVNKIHAMLDKKAAPARPKTADRARSKPLVPKEVIKLDDDDFDSF